MRQLLNRLKHQAFLQFAHEDSKIKTLKDIRAEDVAKMLHQYKVPCAVLNACKSACPEAGDSGNLSRLFAENNSLRILAMSFKIAGTAIELLIERFYTRLFDDLDSFSDAASRARTHLRETPDRTRDPPTLQVKDWFVPVTYAYNEDGIILGAQLPLKPRYRLHIPRRSTKTSNKSTSSASSWISSRTSVEHDPRSFLQLEMSDLAFERELMYNTVIRVSGPASAENHNWISYLSDIWRMTNFSEPFDLDAEAFLGSDHAASSRYEDVRNYIWGEDCSSRSLPTWLQNNDVGNNQPRPIIIIRNADALFQNMDIPYRSNLRQKLNKFLEEAYLNPDEYPNFRAPFLIFISIENIQQKSIDEAAFPLLGGVGRRRDREKAALREYRV
jgi:hypothetical protein